MSEVTAIQKGLVYVLLKEQPELFALIGLFVDKGGKKSQLMAKVNTIAVKDGLTSGLCDAAYDFFNTEEGKAVIKQFKDKAKK